MKKVALAASVLALMVAQPALAQNTDTTEKSATEMKNDAVDATKEAAQDAKDAAANAADKAAEATNNAVEATKEAAQDAAQATKEAAQDAVDATKEAAADAKAEMKNADATSSHHWRASNLVGLAIVNAKNESIGDVNDLLITDDGKVDAVIVGVGGFLGIGEKNVSMPFGELTFRRNDDGKTVAVSSATKETLESMPEWKAPEKR